MAISGGCHCGAIRYELQGQPANTVLCHCSDCRRNAGAPVVAWAGFPEESLKVTKGEPRVFNSSGATMRSFCPNCGTGLFYRNAEYLPGIVDVQLSTFDDPEALPPTMQIQVAERLGWMTSAHQLKEFDRFPR